MILATLQLMSFYAVDQDMYRIERYMRAILYGIVWFIASQRVCGMVRK